MEPLPEVVRDIMLRSKQLLPTFSPKELAMLLMGCSSLRAEFNADLFPEVAAMLPPLFLATGEELLKRLESRQERAVEMRASKPRV